MSGTRYLCTMAVRKADGSVRPCGAPVNIDFTTEHGDTTVCQLCNSRLQLIYTAPHHYLGNIPVGGPKILKPVGSYVPLESV